MSFFSKMQDDGYGNHPTIYNQLDNSELYSMYRGDVWSTLDEDHRQQLLQETVNRAAASMGEKGACEVKFSDLGTGTYGCQHGNIIELNRMYFAEDMRVIEFKGHIIQEEFADSNYMALETALHENIHAWQNQCIDGTIECSDKALLEEYKANCFTTSVVENSKGEQVQGSHYLNGKTNGYGYYFYYFQSTERDAHNYSEIQTQNIVNQNIKQYGEDISAQEYKAEVKQNGYDATLQNANRVFGYDNVEHDINTTLKNDYFKTNNEVNPTIAALVHNEMAESYNHQHGISYNDEVFDNNSLLSDNINNDNSNHLNSNTWENDIKCINDNEENTTVIGSSIDYSILDESNDLAWESDVKCMSGDLSESIDIEYQDTWDVDIKCGSDLSNSESLDSENEVNNTYAV